MNILGNVLLTKKELTRVVGYKMITDNLYLVSKDRMDQLLRDEIDLMKLRNDGKTLAQNQKEADKIRAGWSKAELAKFQKELEKTKAALRSKTK